MANARIILYGAPHLERDGQRQLVAGRKSRLLLAYLALHHGELHMRETLAGTLWPEADQAHAQQSLRQALSEVRKTLGPLAPRVLVTERGTVTLRTNGIAVDVAVIEGLINQGDPDSVEEALDLAVGELLEGLDEPWIVNDRERLERLLREAGTRTASDLLATGDNHRALLLCQRVLQRERADEEAHRLAFQVYAERRDLSGLIRQYRSYQRAVREELDAEPSDEATRLFQRLRAGIATGHSQL